MSVQMKGFVAPLRTLVDLSIRRMHTPVALRADLDEERQSPLSKRTMELLTTPA